MSSGKSSRRSSISNILDAFNLSSRDTQNKVHRSWSQPSSDGEAPGPSNKRGPDPSDLEADASLNPSVHYEFTRKDPMGAIILSILGELTMLANKSNKAMSADIDDICEKFHNHQISEKQKINRRIMQTTADLERSMIEKELNSHALNQTVEAPMHFSPTPTLQTPRQTADCLKLLPSGSHKFSGTANSLSIVEYLYNLNQVQEQCNLSLDEFYKAMLASTTGAPYTYIMGAIKNNEDPANIYHNLLIRYDKRLQPEEARVRLYAYRIPRSATLAEAETHIHELATQATSSLPEGPARAIACNHEEVQALFRALPTQSATLVRNLYSNLSTRLGESATASDLSRLLNTYRHSIDQDIKLHGGDSRRPFDGRKFFKRPANSASKGRRYTSFNVTQTNAPSPFPSSQPSGQMNRGTGGSWRPKPFGRPGQTSGGQSRPSTPGFFRPSNFRSGTGAIAQRRNTFSRNTRGGGFQGRSRQPVRNFSGRTFGNGSGSGNNQGSRGKPGRAVKRSGSNFRGRVRDYCSLCGKRDHKAVDGCPHMVSDAGRVVPIMPCKDTCSVCPPFVRTPLNHPSYICPFRVPHGPLSSK